MNFRSVKILNKWKQTSSYIVGEKLSLEKFGFDPFAGFSENSFNWRWAMDNGYSINYCLTQSIKVYVW